MEKPCFRSTPLTEAVLAISPGRPWPTQTRAGPTQMKFCPSTPLLLAYPKFAWPFDWPTQMKIPITAPAKKTGSARRVNP